jgi:hypothetical protein
MLINEVVSAEGKLELWRMVSDSMWAALDAQVRAEVAAKAERDAVRKPRKRTAGAAKPKSVPVPPRAAPPAAKPSSSTAASTPATQQPPPTQPSTPVQQPSATATGVQQASAANAEVATAAKPKPNMPQGATLLARARGVLDDAV